MLVQLFVEAADDDQRKVDAQAEADHRRGVQRKDRDVGGKRQQVHRGQGEHDAGATQQQRNGGGNQRAEHEHQEHRHDRQRHHLGVPQIALAGLPHVDVAGRLAGHVVLEVDLGEGSAYVRDAGFDFSFGAVQRDDGDRAVAIPAHQERCASLVVAVDVAHARQRRQTGFGLRDLVAH